MANTEIRLIIFFAAKDGEALCSQQKRQGADCGSNHELFIAKFRFKLMTVGKTTRSFSYDLNQIPYDYLCFTLGQISYHTPDPWTLQSSVKFLNLCRKSL